MDWNKFKYDDNRGERSGVLPKLNRSALAKEMGVSRSQLSRILMGKSETTVVMLRRLAASCGASLDEVDVWLKGLRESREKNKKVKLKRRML